MLSICCSDPAFNSLKHATTVAKVFVEIAACSIGAVSMVDTATRRSNPKYARKRGAYTCIYFVIIIEYVERRW